MRVNVAVGRTLLVLAPVMWPVIPSAVPPVQTPVAAKLVINADTIEALGLDLDAATIGMADRVVNLASSSRLAGGNGDDEEAHHAH